MPQPTIPLGGAPKTRDPEPHRQCRLCEQPYTWKWDHVDRFDASGIPAGRPIQTVKLCWDHIRPSALKLPPSLVLDLSSDCANGCGPDRCGWPDCKVRVQRYLDLLSETSDDVPAPTLAEMKTSLRVPNEIRVYHLPDRGNPV